MWQRNDYFGDLWPVSITRKVGNILPRRGEGRIAETGKAKTSGEGSVAKPADKSPLKPSQEPRGRSPTSPPSPHGIDARNQVDLYRSPVPQRKGAHPAVPRISALRGQCGTANESAPTDAASVDPTFRPHSQDSQLLPAALQYVYLTSGTSCRGSFRLRHAQASRPMAPVPLDVLDQAALRAAFAGGECDGKARMGGSSSWSKAIGFAVLLVTLRRKP